MKRKNQALMGVLFVMVIACLLCGALFILGPQLSITQFIGSNPVTARKIGNSILGYDLPMGYLEYGGRNLGFIKMVVITPDGNEPEIHAGDLILISTYPTIFNLSEEQFQQELRLALLRSTDEVTTMEFVQEAATLIRGEEVKLRVYESFGAYDVPTRIVISSIFPGLSEDVMVMFAGPTASWNLDVIVQFLRSIR